MRRDSIRDITFQERTTAIEAIPVVNAIHVRGARGITQSPLTQWKEVKLRTNNIKGHTLIPNGLIMDERSDSHGIIHQSKR